MPSYFLVVAGTLLGLLIPAVSAQSLAPGQEREMIRGADVSMLVELESAGAKYFADAKTTEPADPIRVMRDHGVDWFRLRLFVNPGTDYASTWGATQDLKQVRALAKRIKAVGGKILLDLHYSDTWADGVKQAKPKAWEGQGFESLQKTLYDYTRSVLNQLGEDGAMPEMVQIGNEIAGGMVFPDGKVLGVTPEKEAEQWSRFSVLLNAGSKAVRDTSTAAHPIRVMIHIHGGGHDGVPMWFFSKLEKHPVDFDVIGLSFYPAWGDSIERLELNLAALAGRFDKPVVLAEVAYPAKDIGKVKEPELMKWPLSPQGQSQFTRDLFHQIRTSRQCIGAFWWYPEAVPAGGYRIWRDGAEAFFDENGRPREVLDTFGNAGR